MQGLEKQSSYDPLSFGNVDISEDVYTFSPSDDPSPQPSGAYPPLPPAFPHQSQTQSVDPFASLSSAAPTNFATPDASFQSFQSYQQSQIAAAHAAAATNATQQARTSSSGGNISKSSLKQPSGGPVTSSGSSGGNLQQQTSGVVNASTGSSYSYNGYSRGSSSGGTGAGQPVGSGRSTAGGSQDPFTASMAHQPSLDSLSGRPSGSGGGAAPTRIVVHSPTRLAGPTAIPGVNEFFTAYSISTTLPGASAPSVTVRRRFRDVVALADVLHLLFPGYFVPPRPSRNAIEGRRMTARFVEDRRIALEGYLNKLAAHPAIGSSEALQVFLEAEGALVNSSAWKRLVPASRGGVSSVARFLKQVVGQERLVPTPRDVVQPAGSSGDIHRLITEKVAAMRGVVKGAVPTSAESRLREESAWLDEVREGLLRLSHGADHWVARHADKALLLDDMAKAMQALSTYEHNSQFRPGTSEEVLADGCARVGKQLQLSTDQSAKYLAPITHALAMMPVAATALSHREAALLTVLTLEADAQAKRTKLALWQTDVAKYGKKLDALRFDLGLLDSSLAAARSEYERVLQQNSAEIAALKASMCTDLAAMVREFAAVQAASTSKEALLWQETAQRLADGVRS